MDIKPIRIHAWCPKSTGTPDKVEILKKEALKDQLRRSPRLNETLTPTSNKYRLGRKEVADIISNARQDECVDDPKDTRTSFSTDPPHGSQTEQGVKTPRQRHQSTEDYRRELKNLEDCWNKDFSPELRNTPRHLRWRAKETNDELSSKRDKPIESSESTPSASLPQSQIETPKPSNSGTNREKDIRTPSTDERRTSRSRTESSANKQKSQKNETNTTLIGKQRTKRTINFYDSHVETRPVHQDNTSANSESREQDNVKSGDGRKMKKNKHQINTETYIIEKVQNSDEQEANLTVQVKRSGRWNDDDEYYQYKRRKKLRSEITKEELWEGFPLNVCFKRQPLKPKSVKCTEIKGRDKLEIRVHVSAPEEISFYESNKSGNASTDISHSGTNMPAKDRTFPDTEDKMEKLSHETDTAHIDASVYEFHKSHVIINVSLKKTTLLDADSDMNESEENALLADSKSNISHSAISAVSEIDSATERELLRDDSQKNVTAAKDTKTDLTNLPKKPAAAFPETESCTPSLDTCVKYDLQKHLKVCVSTKPEFNDNGDNSGVDVDVGAKESYLSIKNSTTESKEGSNPNQNDILTAEEGVKGRIFDCIGGYTCVCNKPKEDTTHLVKGEEIIDISTKAKHMGVNIGHRSRETISHDETKSKIYGESVVQDVSGCQKKATISKGRIEGKSSSTHEHRHVTRTVSEQIQESALESGPKMLPTKKDSIQDSMQRRTPSRKRKRSGADVITPKRSARLQEKSLRTPNKDEISIYTCIKTNDQSITRETAAPSGDVEVKTVDDLYVDGPAVHSKVDCHALSAVIDEAVSMGNSATSGNMREDNTRIDSVANEQYLDLRAAKKTPKDKHDPLRGVSYTGEDKFVTESSQLPINGLKITSEERTILPSIIERDEKAIGSFSKERVVKGVTRNKKSKLCDECHQEDFSSEKTKRAPNAIQCIRKERESKIKTICRKGKKRSTNEEKLKFNETENIASGPEEIEVTAIEDKNKNLYSKAKHYKVPQESNRKEEDSDIPNLKSNDCKEILGRSSTRNRAKNTRQVDIVSRYSGENVSKKNRGKVKEEAKFINKPLKFDKEFQNQIGRVNQKGLPERILRHEKYSMVQDSDAKTSSINTKNQRSNKTDDEKKSEEFDMRIMDSTKKTINNASSPNRAEFVCSGSVSSHSNNPYNGNELLSGTLLDIKEASYNQTNSDKKELHNAEFLQSVVAKGTDDNESPSHDSSLRSSQSNQRLTKGVVLNTNSPRTSSDESRGTIKALIPEEESSSISSTAPNIFNNFCELVPAIIPRTNCEDTNKDEKPPPLSSQSLPSSSSKVNDPNTSNGTRSKWSEGSKEPQKHCELNAPSNRLFEAKVVLSPLHLTSESDYDSDVGCEYPITESRSDHNYSASSDDFYASNRNADRNQASEMKRRIKMKYPFKCRSKNASVREKLNVAIGQQCRNLIETGSEAQELSYDKSKMSTRSSENREETESTETKVKLVTAVLGKKKGNRTPNKTSKGRKDYRSQTFGTKKSSPSSSARRKSNEKRVKDADDLLYNSMLEKHACVLWSSEHRRHYQLTRPDATPSEVDQLLRKEWETLSVREKLRYLERARYALRDENKPTKYRRKKAHDPLKEVKAEEDPPKPISRMMEKFLSMASGVQLAEIKKWLHFYHEVSPEEYASVMTRFKKALKDKKSKLKFYAERANKTSDSYDSTVDGQAKYRRLLFEKMLESREKIINLFTEKKAIQKKFLLDNFNNTVKKLIAGEDVEFVREIKSERLTEVLNDLRSLESARKIDVSGEPLGTKSFENLTSQLQRPHDRDNSLDASLHQDVYNGFEDYPSEDVDLINNFLMEIDSPEVPNVDPDTIEALLGVDDHSNSESPRCIFFHNVSYPHSDDMGHCQSFQGTRPIYSNAASTSKTCCPSSILTDWVVTDYMTAMDNRDGRLRPNEHNAQWTALTRDSPWQQVSLIHKTGLVSHSSGGYTRYPFYLTIPSSPAQDFGRQPSPRMQEQKFENRNSNASFSNSYRQRLVCGKQKDKELQVAWCDDARKMRGSQGIQVEKSLFKRPIMKIDCSQMHFGSNIFYSVSNTTK